MSKMLEVKTELGGKSGERVGVKMLMGKMPGFDFKTVEKECYQKCGCCAACVLSWSDQCDDNTCSGQPAEDGEQNHPLEYNVVVASGS